MKEAKIKVESPMEKLKKKFDETIESGMVYHGRIEDVNCCQLLQEAIKEDKVFKLYGTEAFLFNCKCDGLNSILLLFSLLAKQNNETGEESKHVSERVMDIIKVLEDCFTVVDSIEVKDVKEDKRVYVVAIKKLERKKK
jgi:hypothetical protein